MSLIARVAAPAALLAALSMSGCSCDAPASSVETPAVPEEVEAEPPRATLPTASRSDLPAVTPMVTVEVTDDELHVSNAALIATWPAHDREALARAQPLGDARWPEVEETVSMHGDDLSIPTLREAFAHAANVDHARASLSGSTGTPIAFAVRAAPDVRFIRILQAVYAAGLSGYAEPRLVMMSTASEVMLPLPLPRAEPAHAADVAQDLGRALASVGLEGRTRPSAADALGTEGEPTAEAPAAVLAIVLAADGLHVSRDAAPLSPGCAARAETDVVTITLAELTPGALTRCLDAAGEASITTFRTSADTRYADAVAILETLAQRGPVGLAISR